jgi:hypothetical protein
MRFLRGLLLFVGWLVALGCVAWAGGALAYDLPWASLRLPAAIAFLIFAAVVLFAVRGAWRKILTLLAAFSVVLTWWLTLQPSNHRPWQPDVDRTPWAEVQGDNVTFHNVRNCEYRTEMDYTPRWETRTVHPSKITGIDLAINYWGSPWMAHPIASFQFSDSPPLCFSIETRKQIGQSYSAIGGLYRQFELIYVVADERDVLRVRTNYRKGEDIYLYRLNMQATAARGRFFDYLGAVNELRDHPRWYNAVTTNCTTSIRTQRNPAQRAAWDWRMLLNGKGDEMLYERGSFVNDGLPFAELKKRALINPAAQAANDAPDFSQRIREGRPGFGK